LRFAFLLIFFSFRLCLHFIFVLFAEVLEEEIPRNEQEDPGAFVIRRLAPFSNHEEHVREPPSHVLSESQVTLQEFLQSLLGKGETSRFGPPNGKRAFGDDF
jgi:hypothetical protein